MTNLTVWLLWVAVSGSGMTPPEKFATQAECQAVAADIFKQSSNVTGMPYMRGICTKAEILIPKA